MAALPRHIAGLCLTLLLLLPCWAMAQADTTAKPKPDSLPRRQPVAVTIKDSSLLAVKRVLTELSVRPRTERKLRSAYLRAEDSASFAEATQQAADLLSREGYAEASLDSHRVEGKVLRLWHHQGPRYFLRSLSAEGLNEQQLNKWNLERLRKAPQPLDWRGVERRLALTLDEFQHVGYPFARFDSLRLGITPSGDSMLTDVAYRFAAGPLVRIDSVIFKGDIRERDYFLWSLTGVRPGDRFDQRAIDQMPRLLNNSIYFRNAKAPVVTFNGDSAKVVVTLEKRRSGRFDLLLGVLPPKANETKVQFTGLLDIQLVSPVFRAGEILRLRVDKLPGTSQKMLLQYSHPYLFATPVRLQMDFDLLKQDTSFFNRNLRFSSFYQITRPLAIKVYYRQKTSSLISTTRYRDDSLTVPPVLDSKDQIYGLGFEFENVDYRYNPTRGWWITADFGIGRKRIVNNPALHDNIYTGLQLLQPKREAELLVQFYRSPAKRYVILLANRSYWLQQVQYFTNDMAQIGGSKVLRGFNENEFFANTYSIFTFENRFILEQNSYLFAFMDYAWLENRQANPKIQQPWGIGAGMAYETKAGIVSVTYAAGKSGQFAFQPARGRIHVGLVNQF
jgi:outer membrane protein assembly factor BamA